VTDDLILPRERLRCLRSYLNAVLGARAPKPVLRKSAASIRHRASRLLRHRHVRELQQPPLGPEAQNVIWVRGEEVCVTREFHDALEGQIPERLLLSGRRLHPSSTWGRRESQVTCCRYTFRGVGKALLVQRQGSDFFRWLWTKLRRRRLVSPELELAGIIFRLERYGVRCARVLAFGQTPYRPWEFESFLLMQDRSQSRTLSEWMADHRETLWTAQRKQRWRLFREAGSILGRMHQAHCYFHSFPDEFLVIENTVKEGPTLLLAGAQGVCKRRRPSLTLAKKNLKSMVEALGLASLSRTDWMRVLLGYTGQERLTASAKMMAKEVMR